MVKTKGRVHSNEEARQNYRNKAASKMTHQASEMTRFYASEMARQASEMTRFYASEMARHVEMHST